MLFSQLNKVDYKLFNAFDKYGCLSNVMDVLKFVAVVSMVIDHIGAYFLPDIHVLRLIGRIAAPIFFFLIGYNSKHKIDSRLFYLGLILTLTTYFLENFLFINILINLCMIQIAIYYRFFELITPDKFLIFMVVFLFLGTVTTFVLEYGIIGWPIAWCGYWMKKGQLNTWELALSVAIFMLFNQILFANVGVNFNVFLMVVETLVTIALISLSKNRYSYPVPYWCLWLSRNTLGVYFVHLFAFKIIHSALTFSNI